MTDRLNDDKPLTDVLKHLIQKFPKSNRAASVGPTNYGTLQHSAYIRARGKTFQGRSLPRYFKFQECALW